jgi:hypothetical protein
MAVIPGGCSCECRGCEDQYGHCMDSGRGCDWSRTSMPRPSNKPKN